MGVPEASCNDKFTHPLPPQKITIYLVFVSNDKTTGVPLPNTTNTNEPPAHTTNTMVKTRVQLEVTWRMYPMSATPHTPGGLEAIDK